jgi:hypothetical protein
MAELFAFLGDPSVRPWLIALVVLVDLLALVAIAASHAHARQVKLIWAFIVLLIPVGGAIAWLAIGRERRGRR